MSVKNDVVDFLRTYAHLTGSEMSETGELISLELSEPERRKHLLSLLKFSFSKEVCEKENAELLTVTNTSYQAILSVAKQTGIVVVSRSFQTEEPVLMLNYLLTMTSMNHMKEEMRSIAFRASDYSPVDPVPFWTEAPPSAAAELTIDADLFAARLRDSIIEDISDLRFRFEDEVERRIDRERTMIRDYYEQHRKEREGASFVIETEIAELTRKLQSTNSMKVYNSTKKKIEALRRKIVELDRSKSKDLDKIQSDFERNMNRIWENHKIKANVVLLNAMIVLPLKTV